MRAEDLKAFLKRQMDVKQRKVEEEFKRELEQSTKAQALLDEKEKHFYNYAAQAIQEWGGNGKNVKPLIMELKGYNKRIV